MKIRNQKDFWTGVMFVGFGSLFTVYGMQYRAGNAAKMGAGYFPRLLSVILILTGIVLISGSLLTKTGGEELHKFNWRIMVLIISPVFLFGLLLHPLGLVFTLFILVVGTSFASAEFQLKGTLINSIVLILLCVVIFVWSLKLQFQIWPFFIGR